ncbi:hypothetical protein AbraIFM66951_008722 [Aspergillus brasiliensis]|uniref:NmrA-like domain-containing protein n=1 Tax=Aspergillus brasiliensis TaxID=319629 RepID=A0A9W6DLM2_9EURO|nr:hypothetical protein AbraCBS73388_007729 [Aspergillus brasiliensis]GKZ45854.1 hypothetical protein AbraIFM66951_008722 [Aspergillus brasiliensis]
MVKVAIAGGSGNVAQEVIDRILAKGSHEIVVLSRRIPQRTDNINTRWVQVDYESKASLVRAFSDIDTVLSFLAIPDPTSMVRLQKNMIDAAIEAGVRRFAPSEWGSTIKSDMGIYGYKDEVRRYLAEVNEHDKRLEYCLFQPGFFTNYFGHPYSTAKYFSMSATYVDFENRRALLVDDGDHKISLTTVQDMAGVVAEALEYPGQWPTVGGFSGSEITLAELIQLGEEIRGPFEVEKVFSKDLRAGELKASWYPVVSHPSIPSDRSDEMSKMITTYFLRGVSEGGWHASHEWNDRLPDFPFTPAKEYLTSLWKGRP